MEKLIKELIDEIKYSDFTKHFSYYINCEKCRKENDMFNFIDEGCIEIKNELIFNLNKKLFDLETENTIKAYKKCINKN